MSQLSPDALSTLEHALRQRRTEILGHVKARMHADDNPELLALVNRAGEPGERLSADVLADTDIALLDHELAALRDVERALARLEAGEAGVCAECGEAIPAARLLANPTATTCVGCQQIIERHAHHAHG